jgi:cytochrome c5
LINTPKQLVVVVLLSFIVPLATILLIVNFITGGMNVNPDSPAMSEDAIAERLKPVGQVNVGPVAGDSSAADSGAQPAGTAATASAEATAGAGTSANAGEQVYNTSCAVCHGAGLAGAPKSGDKAAWKTRIAQGNDALYASAINGKNAMPPKGGAMSTSDADIKAAVDFMVSKSK